MNLVKHNPDKMSCKNIAGMIVILAEEFQSEYDKLHAEITRLTAERDAAIQDLRIGQTCDTCAFKDNDSDSEPCDGCIEYSSWQWRGTQPETAEGRTHDGQL